MTRKTIKKDFVSDIDQKLASFDASHMPSEAQQFEQAKYQRIHKKRDTVCLKAPKQEDAAWDDF